MVKDFEAKARNLGAAAETAYAARYALCALIDETVLATPWGSQSTWTTESLLGTLHNETRGGAKFFQILDNMTLHPELAEEWLLRLDDGAPNTDGTGAGRPGSAFWKQSG